jgi:1,4-dihydroxy-2-naphthoyl-CoA hydrolase
MNFQKIPWRADASIGAMNDRSQNTMPAALGIVFTRIGEDFLQATMPVGPITCQPMRLLHGGASVVLAETLASVAANCCLDDHHAAVGQEINANHLRPALEGELVTGTTRLLHAGARSQVWSIDITNARGQTVCVSRITLAIINRR